jgi:hypothetical protein
MRPFAEALADLLAHYHHHATQREVVNALERQKELVEDDEGWWLNEDSPEAVEATEEDGSEEDAETQADAGDPAEAPDAGEEHS